MKHLSEGELRAFHDDALSAAEQEVVQEHLQACARCAERAERIQARGRRVETLLAGLEPATGQDVAPTYLARRRLKSYIEQKKERNMARNPLSRRYRPAWAVATLLVLLLISLAIPPVRTFAGDLLSLFRVQEIEFTDVDLESLPDEETVRAVAPQIESMFDDDLTVTLEGEPEVVDEATARARAGFPIRAARQPAPSLIQWGPPVHVAFEVDLPRIKTLFGELGYTDVALPASLDGAVVEAQMEGMVQAHYGECEVDSPERQPDCIVHTQMPGPVISVPDNLDVEQLTRVYLELLGMTEEEAAGVSERLDWSTTLLVPFPRAYGLTYKDVEVDGVEGTLLFSMTPDGRYREYLLTWSQGGVIHSLRGYGDFGPALALADSLQ